MEDKKSKESSFIVNFIYPLLLTIGGVFIALYLDKQAIIHSNTFNIQKDMVTHCSKLISTCSRSPERFNENVVLFEVYYNGLAKIVKDEEFQNRLVDIRSKIKGVQMKNFTCKELEHDLQEFRSFLTETLNKW